MTTTLLKPGDIIHLDVGHRVYTQVPAHLVYSNRRGDWSLVTKDVTINEDEFSYLIGDYLVTLTQFRGGSSEDSHDVFPNGHLASCQKIGSGLSVSFYQDGAFTAVNREIKPININALTCPKCGHSMSTKVKK